jgi:hypothetical protein
MSLARIFTHVAGLLWLLAGIGCGGSDGPPRYDVHGSVTYDGQPVPKGFITILPDSAKGNEGPGGGAAIENGTYRTEPGKGVIGGPHTVRIVGYDGVPTSMEGEQLPDGQPLFAPYETTIDFPRQDFQQDFKIPKAAN